MFGHTRSYLGLLLLAGAIVPWSAGTSLAAPGHFGGHAGGVHVGGFRAGGFHTGAIHAGGFHAGAFRPGFAHGGFGRLAFYPGFSRPYLGRGYYGVGGYGYPYFNSFAYPAYSTYSYPYPSAGYYFPYEDYDVYPNANGPIATLGAQQVVPAAPVPQNDRTAVIHVRVPPNAQVWFSGEKTTTTGTVREFQSPPLTPGAKYAYDIRARWMQDGRVMEQTQTVTVWAGADITATFPKPADQPEEQQR